MSGIKANPGFASAGTNLSDVIDVIVADSDSGPGTMTSFTNNMVYSTPQPAPARPVMESRGMVSNSSSATSIPDLEAKRRAYVKIMEQPASKALRFRYECEGRSAGSIPGSNSTTDNKSFPAIQVVGYRGKAVVVVSCVTKDPPYRPHPHSLVGKEGCNKGVCTMHINNENMVCTFSNLGIQCVKKKGIDDALRQREEVRVDPFKTGFGHRNQPQSIDLNAVRLCFQVFLEGAQKDRFTFPLKPVVSDPIYDKKAMCDLNICKMSDCTSPVSGGKDVILLCDKVTKDDIQIRFYEENEGHVLWEGYGDFQSSDVHKQVAISFRTPRYRNMDVLGPVSTCIQLVRPSDKAASEPRPFQYLPLDSGMESGKRLHPHFDLFCRILAMDAACLARDVWQSHAPQPAPFETCHSKDASTTTQCLPVSMSDAEVQTSLPDTPLVEPEVKATPPSPSLAGSEPPLTFLESAKRTELEELAVLPLGMENGIEIAVKGENIDKGVLKADMNASAVRLASAFAAYAVIRKERQAQVNRSSLSTIYSEGNEPRFSTVSSEDLNSRLSAALSDVSEVSSLYSEDTLMDSCHSGLSLASSSHTLNDELGEAGSDHNDSFSESTPLGSDDEDSETASVDTIEQQLQKLQSMSVDADPNDFQTYSSFQLAMKNPILELEKSRAANGSNSNEELDQQVYDDPDNPLLPDEPLNEKQPALPPRITSVRMRDDDVIIVPPLPPRRFKKMSQPLPATPRKEATGLKTALNVIKQTFKRGNGANSSKVSPQASPRLDRAKIIDAFESDSHPPIVIEEKPEILTSKERSAKSQDHLVESPGTNNESEPIELSEAENFALYAQFAPLATTSEFDDSETMSLLYADLKGVKEEALNRHAEVLKRKRLRLADSNNSRLAAYIRDSALESQRLAATAPSCNDFDVLATSRPVLRPSVRPKVKQEPIDHGEMGGNYYVDATSPNALQSGYNTTNINLPQFPISSALSPGAPLYVAPPTSTSHLYPPSPNYPMSVSPGNHSAYVVSPVPSVGLSPGHHNNYNIPISRSPVYNIPPSPHYVSDAGGVGMATSIMDLDHQFIEQQATLDLNELPPINLPLSESNLSCLDSHMLENLSLLDVDTGAKTTANSSGGGAEHQARNTYQESARLKENNYNHHAPSAFSMELTDLSLSGLLSGTEFDGADSISRTIKELDALNAMSGKPDPS